MTTSPQTMAPSAELGGVTIERLNPVGLFPPAGYVHVVSVRGGRSVHVAGQAAINEQGELVGAGDLAAQTEQALRNVATALAAAGATMDDVVRATILVVDWDRSKTDTLMDGVMRAAGDVGAPVAAITLVPVPCLYEDGVLVEIGVEAVIA